MQLLADGIKLMVFGMGTVFAFLMLMILFMGLMTKLLAPFKDMLAAPAPAPKKPAAQSGADTDLAAVAAAAVALYRNRK